jgi:hypothetical protein
MVKVCLELRACLLNRNGGSNGGSYLGQARRGRRPNPDRGFDCVFTFLRLSLQSLGILIVFFHVGQVMIIE